MICHHCCCDTKKDADWLIPPTKICTINIQQKHVVYQLIWLFQTAKYCAGVGTAQNQELEQF